MLVQKINKYRVFILSTLVISSVQNSLLASESMNHDHSQMHSQNQFHTQSGHKSKYIGQKNRLIKSLSLNDIAQLKTGKGWGLAKAAELNGVPGPSHLLQMKQQINLTSEQEDKINKLFLDMKQSAILLGKKLIILEQELNTSFANNTVNESSLEKMLSKISDIRSKLRYVHLSTHLKTPTILSSKQIAQYNKLRGY